MLLAIDIGNTTIAIAFMDGRRVTHSFRLMTTSRRSSDEVAVLLRSFIDQAGRAGQDFDSAVISSVVPALTSRVNQAVQDVTGRMAHIVSPQHAAEYGICLDVSEPSSVGADIIVDCVAAANLYQGPVLVVDCGTATKYIYVDGQHRFSRLAIGLGIEVGTRGLTASAAQLPQIELTDPGTVLGRDTLSAMRAGLYYGFLGSIDYTLRQFVEELAGLGQGQPGGQVGQTGLIEAAAAASTGRVANASSRITDPAGNETHHIGAEMSTRRTGNEPNQVTDPAADGIGQTGAEAVDTGDNTSNDPSEGRAASQTASNAPREGFTAGQQSTDKKAGVSSSKPHIVTTGGLGGVFTPDLPLVDQYDPDLLYKGLAIIAERVRP